MNEKKDRKPNPPEETFYFCVNDISYQDPTNESFRDDELKIR